MYKTVDGRFELIINYNPLKKPDRNPTDHALHAETHIMLDTYMSLLKRMHKIWHWCSISVNSDASSVWSLLVHGRNISERSSGKYPRVLLSSSLSDCCIR